MGETKSDECIFCGTELEEWHYEYFQENGERAKANDYNQEMDICKKCIKKLKLLLENSK